ncbi:hypothetical protein [Streptomyces sp. NPDC005476]
MRPGPRPAGPGLDPPDRAAVDPMLDGAAATHGRVDVLVDNVGMACEALR